MCHIYIRLIFVNPNPIKSFSYMQNDMKQNSYENSYVIFFLLCQMVQTNNLKFLAIFGVQAYRVNCLVQTQVDKFKNLFSL